MKYFTLIMSCIYVLLFIVRLINADYSNFFTLKNIFNLLLPIVLLYVFFDRYLKEIKKQN